ncbi:MAG: type II toxin-antitoxin system RelE/ParE family toxin [Chloroflexi bacterium]|jgi:mRNA interferase RelE/StbE|nr:type II toxin-antitoxin system RelE/ParE family toxin [Chloroflexota bacterium]
MYQIYLLDAAARELADLDKSVRQRIIQRMKWLAENLEDLNPVALRGDLAGLYKFRVGDYRVGLLDFAGQSLNQP